MPRYDYSAETPDGKPEIGTVDAESPDEARRLLRSRGLVPRTIEPSPPNIRRNVPVPAAAVAGRLADAANASQPLEVGLRAMAEELSGTARRGVHQLCERLEAGESPERALVDAPGVPEDLAGVIRIGIRTGNLGPVLARYVEQSRERADRRARLFAGLAYPFSVAVVAFLVVGFAMWVIVPGFRPVFEEFGIELPAVTTVVIGVSDFLVSWWGWVLAFVVGVPTVAVALALTSGGRELVWCLCYAIPVLGTVLRSNGIATFCDHLSLLVSQRVPLPEALRLVSEAGPAPDLAAAAGRAADAAEAGHTDLRSGFPASLDQILLWSADDEAFAEALEVTARLHDARSRANAQLLQSMLGPIVFAIVAVTIGSVAIALLLPLIRLLGALS